MSRYDLDYHCDDLECIDFLVLMDSHWNWTRTGLIIHEITKMNASDHQSNGVRISTRRSLFLVRFRIV